MSHAIMAACLLALIGCVEREAALPVLPAPSLEYPESPATQPSGGDVPLAFPAGGAWSLQFEYAAAQRQAAAPDLDVQASGSAVLRGDAAGRLGTTDIQVTVRPSAPAWSAAVTGSVEKVAQRLAVIRWRVAGAVTPGVLLDGDGDGVRAWAVADDRGLREAHARFEVSERRGSGVQASRLTIAVERQ